MLSRNYILVCLVLITFDILGQKVYSSKQIDSLVQLMTIEEKAGQMTQIDLGVIAKGGVCNLMQPQTLDQEKLTEAIQKYHIGSVLNVGCGSGTISLENWHKILSELYKQNNKLSRLKIPIIYGIDAIHGANYTMGATLFPQQIGQAATWNPQLVSQMYQVTAYETRASGIPWNFSPVLDLGRQPLWSRFFETFGEDVFLAQQFSKASIHGLQGQLGNENVAACMKHFLGYSMPLSGKDRTPAWISERELREYFLPTFQAAIKQGALTVMINSGDINGTPVHIDYDILTRLLRDELGFKGVAVTDWEDVYKLVNLHRVAKDKKEAVKMAILAGIDMSMTPNDFEFTKLLVELIKEGSIPMSRIDESVKRILNLKNQLGILGQVQVLPQKFPLFGSKQFSDLSYQIASESLTLLKNNESCLPLHEEDKVFVCGPAANSLNLLNGAWTHTWQGIDTRFNTKGKLTLIESMKALYGGKNVNYLPGVDIDSIIDIEACYEAAKKADKIVVALGEMPCTELPGNIDNLELNEAQIQLVKRLSTLKKPIVLVCCFNRPRILKSIIENVDAILYAYLPSDEGGRAIADCLFGRINPSGKLPFTYPNDVNAIVHYDHKSTEDLATDFSNNGYKPAFDFGFGLSYSNFSYSNWRVSTIQISTTDSIVVEIDVKNTSKIKGQEVVQLYYRDEVASITPAVKKLLNFKKIELAPEESKTVRFVVFKEDLSFVNKSLKRVTEEGYFTLFINHFKTQIYVQ